MIASLEWIGARARWALVVGCAAALFLPAAASALRPALPALVAMVYALAMLRIDLGAVARRLAEPRRAARAGGLALLMLGATSVAAFGVASALGLGPEMEKAAVYAFLAPPIASAATLCLLMGLNAALALEATVVCSAVAPLVAPPLAAWLLGDRLAISPVEMGARAAVMIGAGAVAALLMRRWIGPETVERRKAALDGVAALAMILFVVPLFDGVGAAILERPGLAAGMLALACVLLLGPQMAAAALGAGPDGGATALVWGVRSVAIWLAALPPDPAFALFVALYQFPMYATPLLMGPLLARGVARVGS